MGIPFFGQQSSKAATTGFKGLLKPNSLIASFLGLFLMVGPSAWASDTVYSGSSFSGASESLLWDSQSDKKIAVLWSARSSGESYADQTDESFLFGVQAGAKIRYHLLDRLTFYGGVNMNFRNGAVQSRFGDFTPSGVFLSSGHFNLDLIQKDQQDILSLQLGVLSQRRNFSMITMGPRAFPGVAQTFDLSFDAFGGRLSPFIKLQQMIPTSYTFNTELIEKEELPTLMTAHTGFSFATGPVDISAYAGMFSFSDLPSKVADQSRFTGNSIIGTGSTSEFIFDFEGWLAGFTAKYDSMSYSLGVAVDMQENTAAPSSFNQAQVIRLFGSKRINKDFGVDFVFGNFFAESDSAPSYYTPTGFGNTNRKGNFLELGFEWVPQKIRLSGRYAKADLINGDDAGRQYDADFIFINLETAYDTIF